MWLVALTLASAVHVGPDVPLAVKQRVSSRVVDGTLAIGELPETRALISSNEVNALREDSFIVRSRIVDGACVVAADGKGPLGKAYAAYAALELVGFRFLHPLASSSPKHASTSSLCDHVIDRIESPALRVRNVHLHTMHPLELTDLLEGWPPSSERDWSAQLPEWDAFLEWLLANRQNEVEWVLLDPPSAHAFATSEDRARRLRTLVDRAHAFGVRVGIDAPIALTQQHAFRLSDTRDGSFDAITAIDRRVDWLFGLGFDFINTESGDTEMTHPDPKRMLAMMNEVTARAALHGKQARIKVHCSAGQPADGFVDVHTGRPLDFNYLPLFADRRLAVEPHTVQMFALDDDAPTYGNRNFRPLRQFVVDAEGTRDVIWHPESAYWISVDVDVPLFLPVYAWARLHDFDVLEKDGALHDLDGQSVFSSGWEWGYWLNDVVAARAAWHRPHDLQSAIAPLVGDDVAREVASIAEDEHRLLVVRRGLGSIAGRDAFDDVFETFGMSGTQPRATADRVLLVDIERNFAKHADALFAIASAHRDDNNDDVARELAASMRVTALRARHVRALHDRDFAAAEGARAAALRVVADAERHYRVPIERIATWRDGPTSYRFGYLATVHDLLYWRRDEAIAKGAAMCRDNIVDPFDVVYGAPGALSLVRDLTKGTFLDDATACFAAPSSSPE